MQIKEFSQSYLFALANFGECWTIRSIRPTSSGMNWLKSLVSAFLMSESNPFRIILGMKDSGI